MIARWQFKRGFRAGFSDAKTKGKRELHAGSRFAQGYKLGVAAYALGFTLEESLPASVRGVFESGKGAQ